MEKFTLTNLKKQQSRFFVTRGDEQVLIEDFIEVIKDFYSNEGITEVSQYISGYKSFKIDWDDLYQASQQGFFSEAKIFHLLFATPPNADECKHIENIISSKGQKNIYIISIATWIREKIETKDWYRSLSSRNCLLQLTAKLRVVDYPNWIINRSEKKLNFTTTRNAAELLARLYENNLIEIVNLLNQFALRKISTLTSDMVEQVSSSKSIFTTFQYIDELLKGNSRNAIYYLNSLYESVEVVGLTMSIIGLIKKELRLLYIFSEEPQTDYIQSKDVYLSELLLGRDLNLNSKFNIERVWDSKKLIYRQALSRLNRRNLYLMIIYIVDIEFASKNFADIKKQQEYLIDFTNAFTQGHYAVESWKNDMKLKGFI